MEKPQRTVELRHPSPGRATRRIRRRDPRSLCRRVIALGCRRTPRFEKRTVVRAHVRDLPEMERQTHPATLRSRRLESRRVGERHQRRFAHGRIHPLLVRHHRRPRQGRKHPARPSLGPHRRGLPAARQTGEQPQRHLVYAGQRHLADRMARSRAATVYP